MDRQHAKQLLEAVRNGSMNVEEGLARLRSLPFVELEGARVDTHRELRCGFPEVVFAQGKEPAELIRISCSIAAAHDRLLVTRLDEEGALAIQSELGGTTYHSRARALTLGLPPVGRGEGSVLIVSAGTADAPVAEEAELTARMLGAATECLLDVGVSGIHRLLAHTERLLRAKVLVVVAGMEGALASVVGGLVDRPVIAVPTSVGYGASFGGIAPLLTMLNSCAAGVSVVNIDNGFGAGYAAAQINRVNTRQAEERSPART